MIYQVWSEGYICTGQHATATLHGSIEADSFRDACILIMKTDDPDNKFFDSDMLSYWGCKLFDNEVDARFNFG